MPESYRPAASLGPRLGGYRRSPMATALVFVDDAVRGTLPRVCIKDGVPTTDQLVVREELGDRAGLGVLWLLLLAGPLGWLGLLVVSFSRSGRGEVLSVKVPMSEPAYQRLRAARRLSRGATVAGITAGALLVYAALVRGRMADDLAWRALALLAAAALVAAIATGFTADRRVRRTRVGLDLDASRRWVTLYGVHPAFASACEQQEQQHQRT